MEKATWAALGLVTAIEVVSNLGLQAVVMQLQPSID